MEKMQQMMMKRYKMFDGLGLLIVLIAFVVSLKGSSAQATFFAVDKAVQGIDGHTWPSIVTCLAQKRQDVQGMERPRCGSSSYIIARFAAETNREVASVCS